jgi:hypothetical protein
MARRINHLAQALMLAALLLGQPVRLLPCQLLGRRAGARLASSSGSGFRWISCTCDVTRFHVLCSCGSGVNHWDGLARLFRIGQASPQSTLNIKSSLH